MSKRYVLDASALLCVLQTEPGADRVVEALSDAVIGAVNFSEVVAKLSERGGAPESIDAALGALDLSVLPFDRELAEIAGHLRKQTRDRGLSLGDRACLALGIQRKAVVLTCDTGWARLKIELRT